MQKVMLNTTTRPYNRSHLQGSNFGALSELNFFMPSARPYYRSHFNWALADTLSKLSVKECNNWIWSSHEIFFQFFQWLVRRCNLFVWGHLVGDHETLVTPYICLFFLLQPLHLFPSFLHKKHIKFCQPLLLSFYHVVIILIDTWGKKINEARCYISFELQARINSSISFSSISETHFLSQLLLSFSSLSGINSFSLRCAWKRSKNNLSHEIYQYINNKCTWTIIGLKQWAKKDLLSIKFWAQHQFQAVTRKIFKGSTTSQIYALALSS